MAEIHLKFYHPDLDVISDRTFRALLKRISTSCRKIQTSEVLYLIKSDPDLTKEEKQSLTDKLKPQLDHIEGFYINRVERGSLEIYVTLTALGVWLLNVTVGESIKEAWKRVNMHRRLVDILSFKERTVVTKEKIKSIVYDDIPDYGRMSITNYKFTYTDKEDILIKIDLGTDEQFGHFMHERYDTAYVKREIKSQLKKIENKHDKDIDI